MFRRASTSREALPLGSDQHLLLTKLRYRLH
jgi:hypothetical protein